MDHIWNNLRQWESIWEERLNDEKACPEHKHKQAIVDELTQQLESIRKAKKEIGRWV